MIIFILSIILLMYSFAMHTRIENHKKVFYYQKFFFLYHLVPTGSYILLCIAWVYLLDIKWYYSIPIPFVSGFVGGLFFNTLKPCSPKVAQNMFLSFIVGVVLLIIAIIIY